MSEDASTIGDKMLYKQVYYTKFSLLKNFMRRRDSRVCCTIITTLESIQVFQHIIQKGGTGNCIHQGFSCKTFNSLCDKMIWKSSFPPNVCFWHGSLLMEDQTLAIWCKEEDRMLSVSSVVHFVQKKRQNLELTRS